MEFFRAGPVQKPYKCLLRTIEHCRRRGTCDGKSAVHPRNLWVQGSDLTGGSQPAKLPLFGGCSLETLTF